MAPHLITGMTQVFGHIIGTPRIQAAFVFADT